jgi:sugar phosphate isomerase/epimerase
LTAIRDFSRLCIHTITTKPWSLEEAAAHYSEAGVAGMTVWRDAIEGRDPYQSGEMLRQHGLEVVSFCRGGFFPHATAPGRDAAIEENRKAIQDAAALAAPMLVLVCGAVPGQPLSLSRQQIREGIAAVLPEAEACRVKLAIEPLHPVYADDRSAINTLAQANVMAESFASPWVGVAVDVYHLWWDPDLESEIRRCGANDNLFAFHICDWKTPTKDILLDRGLMGEGCIDVPHIRQWVEATGFSGYHEVEIFSSRYWAEDQKLFLDKILAAYLKYA